MNEAPRSGHGGPGATLATGSLAPFGRLSAGEAGGAGLLTQVAGHHELDPFGDVYGVVSDALEAATDHCHLHGALNRGAVLGPRREDRRQQLPLPVVHGVVHVVQRHRLRRVAINEGVDRHPQLGQGLGARP